MSFWAKTMYLDATQSLICSQGFNDCPDFSFNMDAESCNIMESTVFDGKAVAQATKFPCRKPSVLTGM